MPIFFIRNFACSQIAPIKVYKTYIISLSFCSCRFLITLKLYRVFSSINFIQTFSSGSQFPFYQQRQLSFVVPFIQVPNEETNDYATLARSPRPFNYIVTGQTALLIISRSYVFVKQSQLILPSSFADFSCICCIFYCVIVLIQPFYVKIMLFLNVPYL